MSTGFEHFQQGAIGFDPHSVARIGEYYDYNYVDGGDPQLALAWYGKAAEMGDIDGMEGLGHMYVAGRGIPAEGAQGVAWYKKPRTLAMSMRCGRWETSIISLRLALL